ncbi:hypothetical protein C2E21_3582 [Chlorella sorokiniana]|uniref:MYND-type domain-containing protein n=1 Tax=Chlorella sorokiniana TaxID=3076 RepID=A0A2P6TU69_CHLSO|nr:hypothetical protein C2E21_3582 [Chlorella sorokiniana]|eukprot:PRW57566.1 hypothetical protein C2E21_3582 [Chlorella sorokiniana]
MRPGTVRHSGLTSIPAAAVAEYTGGSVECLVQAHALDAGPFGSTTAARQALVDTLRRQVESMRRNPEAALDNCSCTLRHAFDCPQLAAALVSSGLLDSMLAAAQARHTTAGRAAREMVARLPDQGLAVLIGLQVGARHTGQTAGSCAATQEAAQQCEAAAASLEAALNALTDRPVAQRAQLYPSKLKPLAQAVAAALETFWEAQEVSKERALELARGSATRSCANLHCTNVGAVGGPSAGQQQGSSRCAACRAVWYCGTACSHADWLPSHRRVCKALAAARQLKKRRRPQQQPSSSSRPEAPRA